MHNPFRYFNSSPEVIRLAVMLYIRYPLSLRQVEDILFERGIDICHETVRFWWNRFGPLFAAGIRKRRVHHGSYSNCAGILMRCLSGSTVKHTTSCQRRSKIRPLGRSKTSPLDVMRYGVLRVVPVVHRRDPRCFV